MRVSRPPCCGCLKCWADVCRVCKKLRKFDDAQLERQFVQHHYRPPVFFCFITVIAVIVLLGSVFWFLEALADASAKEERLRSVFALWNSAGIAFLVSGIVLIVAAHVRRIRERHWDKVALSAAALVFVALLLNTAAYFSYPYEMQSLPMSEGASNKTYLICPALLDLSAMRAAANGTESVLCPHGAYGFLFTYFLVLWMCPLCLTAFGLDVRHYVPLLVTEVVVNNIIDMGLSFRAAYLYPSDGGFPVVG